MLVTFKFEAKTKIVIN